MAKGKNGSEKRQRAVVAARSGVREVAAGDGHRLIHELEMQKLRKARLELEESRDRYRHLYDFAPVGCFTLDRNGLVLEANLTGATLLGTQKRYLTKTRFSRFVSPDFAGAFRLYLKRVFETGLKQSLELELRRKDGSTFSAQMESVTVRGASGDFDRCLTSIIDTTERRQAEEKKRLQAEERLDHLSTFPELNPNTIIELNLEGEVTYINPAARQLFPDLEIGKSGLTHAFLAGVAPMVESFKRGDRCSFTGEVAVGNRWYLRGVICVREFVRVYGLDITEHKQVEKEREQLLRQLEETAEKLENERELLDIIVENTEAPLAYLDRDFNFVRVNSAYARGSGHNVAELIGKNHFALFPNAENQVIFNRVCDTGEPIEFHAKPFEFVDQPWRGVTYWDWTLIPVENEVGGVEGLVLSVVDVTESIRTREQLRLAKETLEERVRERTAELSEANRRLEREVSERKRAEEEIRALNRRLVEVQEEERRKVALELHDQIGQYLTGLKLTLSQAARSPSAASDCMEEAQKQVNALIGQVRQLSLELRPSMLDDLGLLPTLVWYMEKYTAQTNVRVNFKQSGLERAMPPEVAVTVFRIVQEALSNVARHAGVSEADVRIWPDDDEICVQVEDCGVGFEPSLLQAGQTTGLSGMKERAHLLGGSLAVETAPGTGTCIMVRLPVPRKSEEDRG